MRFSVSDRAGGRAKENFRIRRGKGKGTGREMGKFIVRVADQTHTYTLLRKLPYYFENFKLILILIFKINYGKAVNNLMKYVRNCEKKTIITFIKTAII